ncbi:chromate efflux transporter [Rhodoblastus sp.]|uniref:chromate efflux transporter n=1 Tax=Rhodoblastus sp. TaxID=1962975 RepID=UPI003F95A837
MIFLKLGATSFGGPIAHLGYFRAEFVARRTWLDERAFADLAALCQFLPGPASSQVGIALGLLKGGLPGALLAWLGFTLPSALAMTAFGMAVKGLDAGANHMWLHGLKVVAVAVVAQALWGMGRSLCPDRARASMAVAAAIVASLIPGALAQIAVILAGGIIGRLWLVPQGSLPHSPMPFKLTKRFGIGALTLFFILLLLSPLAARESGLYVLQLFDAFFHAGALVFGGGHVVLPLLQAQLVPRGWLSNDAFLAGYGAAQAVPGPLFTISAYFGAASSQSPNGWVGALVALVAIFLPGFLLVIGVLPLWEEARRHPAFQSVALGVNASVVGLLLAAFYQPVWVNGILSAADFMLAVTGYLLLVFWSAPPWLVVILCAGAAGLGWS